MTNPNVSITRRTLVAAAVLAAASGAGGAKGQDGAADGERRTSGIRIRLAFDDRVLIAELYDNPSADDFASMLPLDLTIEDFGGNEKIAHLPRKLTEEGSGPFGDERPYDLCYYVPWGNLAMFHDDYRNPGLIRLGRFVEGQEALHVSGNFPLRIERSS